MTDHYLWDRTGEPDAEIRHLENLLRPFGHDGRPLAATGGRPAHRAPLWRRAATPLALAASVVLLVGTVWTGPDAPVSPWTIETLSGSPAVGGRPSPHLANLGPGAWLETGAGSSVRVRAEGVGSLAIGPQSRLRLLATRPGRHTFELAAGELSADISSAPGIFVVETPSARAIDLGCRYTLRLAKDGTGTLHVELGWVGLARLGRESLVPAGAICATRAARGPGTPYFEGATTAFVRALTTLDEGTIGERQGALAALLADARPIDAITLWHLLTRLDRVAAGRIYDRLAVIAPPPDVAGREAVLGGDPAALGAWWEQLGLGRLEELRARMVRAAR